MAGMRLVETVLSQAILFFTRGVEAASMTNGKSRKKITFPLIALDPEDRLRYPPVSLFFMMCLWSQTTWGVQENLFHIEFVCLIGRCWWSVFGGPVLVVRRGGDNVNVAFGEAF